MSAAKAPTVLGLTEVASSAGVARSTVATWLTRGAPRWMPPMPPHTSLASGPVWDRDAILAWTLTYTLRAKETVD